MNVPPEKVIKFFEVAKSMFAASETKKDYEGHSGRGNKDNNREAVYVKVLAYQDSVYCQKQLLYETDQNRTFLTTRRHRNGLQLHGLHISQLNPILDRTLQ
jgi:hypothetical protein